MNYKEIAAKYDGKVKERVSRLAFFRARLEVLKITKQTYLQAREEYRRNDGEVSAGKSRMWNHYTYLIKAQDKKISAAEIDLARAELGQNEDELYNKLGL